MLAVLCAVSLAACQPLPQPFAEEPENVNPLLSVPDSYGLVVEDLVGVPPEQAASTREILADALQHEGVLASTGSGNARAYRLSGMAGGRPSAVGLDWELRAPDGSLVHRFEGVGLVASGSAAFARDVAGVLRASVSDDAGAASASAPVTADRPSLVLGAIEGAPGDGSEALSRALVAALAIRGIRVAKGDDEALAVRGEVAVEPVRRGVERVDLVWSVVRPDGDVIGTVEQSNEVPAGLLDDRWGAAAEAAADGAADGILGVLQAGTGPH